MKSPSWDPRHSSSAELQAVQAGNIIRDTDHPNSAKMPYISEGGEDQSKEDITD